MRQIAIVGFGCAGYHCARALRAEGFSGAVHVFSDTDLPPYNPMLTTYYAGGRLPWPGLFPFGSLDAIASALSLTIHTRAAAAGLDGKNRTLLLSDGSRRPFDAILISTGARAFVPALPPLPEGRVCVLRTPADAEILRRALNGGQLRSAVVVGASMAGIKAAELFLDAGIPCTLADLAPTLLPLAAAPPVGAELARRVEAKGVALRLGVPLNGIEATERGVALTLGAQTIPADIAVLAMGTRPNLDFLDPSGPAVDRGVLVDPRMESSLPGIYAAGDCASAPTLPSGRHQPVALWANAGGQGAAAAGAMLGRPVRWPGSLVHNITHFMGMDFVGLGDARAQGETLLVRRAGLLLYAVRQGPKLALVNLLGSCRISGVVKNYMTRLCLEEEPALSPAQRVILLRAGLDEELIALLEGRAWKGGTVYG